MPGFRVESTDQNSVAVSNDIKRAHRWRLFKFGNVLKPDELLFAKSVTMPQISFEENMLWGGSIPYKVAKSATFGDLIVTFYDLIGLEPKIRQWGNKVWTENGGVRPSGEYKHEVILYLTDGSGKPIDDAWKFINAWPKNINHGELTYESSEFKTITVTISYDWIEYQAPKDLRRYPSLG